MNRLYTGDEHFTYDGMPTNRLLSDFLFWVSSDLTNSVTRSILAEYIVSSALDLDVTLRQTNEPYRLTYNNSIDIDDNEIVKRERKSKVYVFCLLDNLNRDTIEPLQLEQWKFYVLPTSVLNEHCGEQKTLTLNALKSLEPTEATYETLKSVIDNYAERI